jgi:hypothetical protein
MADHPKYRIVHVIDGGVELYRVDEWKLYPDDERLPDREWQWVPSKGRFSAEEAEEDIKQMAIRRPRTENVIAEYDQFGNKANG